MLTMDAMATTWPRRMDTRTAARYLEEEYGLPIEPKTLVNYRALRKPPRASYFGAKPLYDRTELDRWAREDALQPSSPLTRGARRREGGSPAPRTAAGAANADNHACTASPVLNKCLLDGASDTESRNAETSPVQPKGSDSYP